MALNPIIEAFLAAREQASRDFSQSENRRLQSEEAIARQKHEREVLDQQLKLSNNELAQRKAIADAEHALTKQQLEQTALIARQGRNIEAAKTATEWLTKGLVKPNITGLTGNEGRPVGQIGQMDQMLGQIPSEAPGVGEVPNVPAFAPLFGGDEAFTKQFLGAVTPHAEVRAEDIEDLEMKSKIKQMEDVQRELLRFGSQSKLEGMRQTGLNQRAVDDRLFRAEEGELNRKARWAETNARIASRVKEDTGIAFPPGYSTQYISGESNSQDAVKQLGSKERTAFSKHFEGEGWRFISPSDQTALSRVETLNKTVRNVERLAKLYEAGYSDNAAEIDALNSSIRAVIGTVARGVAGEKGVLTQMDIERINEMLPTWFGKVKTGLFSSIGQKFDINAEKVKQLKAYTESTYGHIFRGKRPEQVKELIRQFGAEGIGFEKYATGGSNTSGGVKFTADQVKAWGAK